MPPKKTYTYVRSMLAIRTDGKPYIMHNHSAADLASTALEVLVYELGTDEGVLQEEALGVPAGLQGLGKG